MRGGPGPKIRGHRRRTDSQDRRKIWSARLARGGQLEKPCHSCHTNLEPPPQPHRTPLSYVDDELPRRIYREGLGCREISPKIRRRRSEFRHGLLRHLIDVRKFKFLAGKGDRSRRRARYVYVYALSSSIAYCFSPLLNSWTRVRFEPQAKYSSMMSLMRLLHFILTY